MARRKAAFDPAEAEAILYAARKVWEDKGADVLEANGGADLPRAHVVEFVLDAGQMEEELSGNPALLAKFRALDYRARIAAVRPAFPFARYGY